MDLMKSLLKESMKSEKSPDDAMRTKFDAAMLDIRDAYDTLYDHFKNGSELQEVANKLGGDKFHQHFKDLLMHMDAVHETLVDIESEVDSATGVDDDDDDDDGDDDR